jgi:hypothetical protein
VRVEKLCDWMMVGFQRGLTPDQIASHIEKCPVCGPIMKAQQKESMKSSNVKIDPEKIPSMMVIGIDNSLNGSF